MLWFYLGKCLNSGFHSSNYLSLDEIIGKLNEYMKTEGVTKGLGHSLTFAGNNLKRKYVLLDSHWFKIDNNKS